MHYSTSLSDAFTHRLSKQIKPNQGLFRKHFIVLEITLGKIMKYENVNFKGYEFLQKLKIDSVLNTLFPNAIMYFVMHDTTKNLQTYTSFKVKDELARPCLSWAPQERVTICKVNTVISLSLPFVWMTLWGHLKNSWSWIQSAVKDCYDVRMLWACSLSPYMCDKRSAHRGWTDFKAGTNKALGNQEICIRIVKNGDMASARGLEQYIITYCKDFSWVSITKLLSFIAQHDVEHQPHSFSANTQLDVIKEVLWLTSVLQCFKRHHIRGVLAWWLLWGEIRSGNIKQRNRSEINTDTDINKSNVHTAKVPI